MNVLLIVSVSMLVCIVILQAETIVNLRTKLRKSEDHDLKIKRLLETK